MLSRGIFLTAHFSLILYVLLAIYFCEIGKFVETWIFCHCSLQSFWSKFFLEISVCVILFGGKVTEMFHLLELLFGFCCCETYKQKMPGPKACCLFLAHLLCVREIPVLRNKKGGGNTRLDCSV